MQPLIPAVELARLRRINKSGGWFSFGINSDNHSCVDGSWIKIFTKFSVSLATLRPPN